MAKTELVFVPTPGIGHFLSTVEFAKLLIQRHPRISVLVIVFYIPTLHDYTAVQAYIESQSLEPDHPNRITFLTLPTLSSPPEPTHPNFYRTLVELHKPLVEQAVLARQPKPVAFVLDMLCVPIIDVANQLGVPSYVYFTAGANLLNLMLRFQSLVDDDNLDVVSEFSNPDAELDLPGFRNRVQGKVLPYVFLDKEKGWFEFIVYQARRFRDVKGILINTFSELEYDVIQALGNQQNIPAVYPVGPILALQGSGWHGDQDSIMGWLDEQPSSSVVFLCFGSMGSFDADQVKEIANGLDRSGHRFLWSLRQPPPKGKFVLPIEKDTFEEALPDGFLGRTAHRGKIIGWAPQVSILAHRAIGGFVSHCGWNSILESLWFGVPIATWPMYSEQQLNAFELVKELELAVEIKIDYQLQNLRKDKGNIGVTAEEVENGVKKLMSFSDEEMRGKIQGMREKSRKALEYGGSSHNCLARFIEDVLM